jgi:anti-sigma regulatory factor (Ser/Thr protein kinase)
MAIQVFLPGRFGSRQLYQFVREVIGEDGQPVSGSLIFDFSRLTFIDGIGLTVFCNTLEWLSKRGVQCTFREYDIRNLPIRYLDDCGFFRNYLGRPLSSLSRVRTTTLPFEKVQHANSFGWIELTAIPWLASKLNVTDESLGVVATSLKEIFNNIEDHSDEHIGCVHIQLYPNKSRIEITVSDFGRGIPANIISRFGQMFDSKAIEYATREGVTTGNTSRNTGSGLGVLIDYVTGEGGDVTIYSRKGGLKCTLRRGGIQWRNPWVGEGLYPGTLINIGLRTDAFDGSLLEREAFEW